jgi:hypothetical protein
MRPSSEPRSPRRACMNVSHDLQGRAKHRMLVLPGLGPNHQNRSPSPSFKKPGGNAIERDQASGPRQRRAPAKRALPRYSRVPRMPRPPSANISSTVHACTRERASRRSGERRSWRRRARVSGPPVDPRDDDAPETRPTGRPTDRTAALQRWPAEPLPLCSVSPLPRPTHDRGCGDGSG